jgi:signal transduction histidine kinase
MTRILKERDRLLGSTARDVGLTATATALLCLSTPGALPMGLYLTLLPIIAAICFAQFRLARPRPLPWIVAVVVLCLTVVLLLVVPDVPLNPALQSAVSVLGGGAVGAVSILLVTKPRRVILILGTFVLAIGTVVTALVITGSRMAEPIALTIAGWGATAITGLWLARTVPETLKRITNMSRAYRAERHASETEAQRRQGARLLHDTVLATLTLLAHSGVGVGATALREQASEDAALLRQLRLGFSPNPAASGDYKLKPVQESTLGNTLESVKQRFRRMGLEVNWHGTGQVLLPSHILDAFLLALAECLENVRRHAGVSEAHVTITDDDDTVRAMVTDAGRGFELDSIESGRLGFTESIVARLRDVGGNARLFSSPGSGTTVVLEVPK